MFSELCEDKIKEFRERNLEELKGDLKNENPMLIKKINNFIERWGIENNYTEDDIINKIKSDKLFSLFFIKDPKKQNFYEICQLEYLNLHISKEIIKLSNNIYFDKGIIVSKKTLSSTKSIDFINKEEKIWYVCKHIEEEGGAQDNQFNDFCKFITSFIKLEDKEKNGYQLCLVYSGRYFYKKVDIINKLININIDILHLNLNTMNRDKKNLGQFYTRNCDKIMKGISLEVGSNIKSIIEPFVGEGDLIDFCSQYKVPLELYDINPSIKKENITIKDTILNPPLYKNKLVITNPPYLARNKSTNKELFDLYKEDDLYKCFLRTLINDNPEGGIIIIPINFWCGVRKVDISLRGDFLSIFEVKNLNIFLTPIFDDTSSTICSFSFHKKNIIINEQNINVSFIEGENITNEDIVLKKKENWVIGYEIINPIFDKQIKLERMVENKQCSMYKSNFRLYGLDSNGEKKIRLEVVEDKDLYIGKISSRTEASFYWNLNLSIDDQILIKNKFNSLLNEERKKYGSLFLSNYRENNRKRISFSLFNSYLKRVITLLKKESVINY